MRGKLVSTILLFVFILAMPAQAVETRSVTTVPSLAINGTVATCSAICRSGDSSDAISVTLSLWRGTTLVARWTASGSTLVTISEQCTVLTGQTYTLVLDYSINGIAQTPISVSKSS